jgi:hypothetical protein
MAKVVIPRLETGTVQDRDDWPGVFIRGEAAMAYAMQLEMVLDDVTQDSKWATLAILRELVGTLRGCQQGANYKEPQRILHLAVPEEP